MEQHQNPVLGHAHIGLDAIGALVDAQIESRQSVLRRIGAGTTVGIVDKERPAFFLQHFCGIAFAAFQIGKPQAVINKGIWSAKLHLFVFFFCFVVPAVVAQENIHMLLFQSFHGLEVQATVQQGAAAAFQKSFPQLIGSRTAEHARPVAFSIDFNLEKEGKSAFRVSRRGHAFDPGVTQFDDLTVFKIVIRFPAFNVFQICLCQKGLSIGQGQQLGGAVSVVIVTVGMQNVFYILDIKAQCSNGFGDHIGSFFIAGINEDQTVACVDQMGGSFICANKIDISGKPERFHIA